MAYLLHIETATKNCSVALSADANIIGLREAAEAGYSHAEKLHVFIEEVLVGAGIGFDQLSAVAVSKGPGSYTGLRIGVSAAKGLCYALCIPLIAVDTLLVLAAQAKVSEGHIIPMIDARRMEVYSAIFNSELQKTGETKAEILSADSYTTVPEKIYIVGDCQEKCQTVLTSGNFNFIASVRFPSAREMVQPAFEKFRNGDFEDVAYFEPLYLKDFMSATKK